MPMHTEYALRFTACDMPTLYTGEILCTIHQSVMEEHKQELQPGAVIILRQVHRARGYNPAIFCEHLSCRMIH